MRFTKTIAYLAVLGALRRTAGYVVASASIENTFTHCSPTLLLQFWQGRP
jgi:hypothetical protein